MPQIVNRKDIQGIVASGYDHLDYARFVFCQIIDCKAAKNWLAKIADRITNAEHPESHKPRACLNLALSWKGLEQLGMTDFLQDCPHEFVGGMNRPEARLILGDSGDSSPEKWDYGSNPERPLHLLALLYGKSAGDLESLYQETFGSKATTNGMREIVEQDSFRKHGDLTEPFGFRDGISQPPVLGLVGRKPPIEHPINTGEFVLGYENELGSLTAMFSIDNWLDPLGYLDDHPKYPGSRRAFGQNGTYLVFRKLVQDVDAYWRFLSKRATDSNGAIDPKKRELLAAKMVGRWRSGSPLVLAPDAPGTTARNDFLFMSTDPDGLACPIGSHIRRANPRDSLDVPPWKSTQVSRGHRIIRRGRKFREFSKYSTPTSQFVQGIFFIALNADLRRQFEFIQQSWINNPTFKGLDNDRDPITGDNTNDGEFTIQSKPVNNRINGLPRFVTVKGGGYFFVPGIRALRFLANQDVPR